MVESSLFSTSTFKSSEWYILGELERPIILANTEIKDDKDGRYGTFTFKRNSVDLPLLYTGNPAVVDAGEVAAGATSITIKANANTYKIANGTTGAAAIASVSGLTKADKGRYITLIGAGTDKPATIADGSTFVLEDGATWTAKEGASITLRVLDTTTRCRSISYRSITRYREQKDGRSVFLLSSLKIRNHV